MMSYLFSLQDECLCIRFGLEEELRYENTNNSDLDGMSLASFCQSRAEW